MNVHQRRAAILLAMQCLGLLGCLGSAWSGWQVDHEAGLPVLHITLAVPSLWATVLPPFWFAIFFRSAGIEQTSGSAGRRALAIGATAVAVAVSGQAGLGFGASPWWHVLPVGLLTICSLAAVVACWRQIGTWQS